ncbi:DUF4833 domain-containing protein [Draconibacterium sp.]|nr:DUF4833 domain-containing protein [Draconibacterium sp.]
MKRNIFKKVTFLSVILLFGLLVKAHGLDKTKTLILFKIGRSKDANEIFYEVNITPDGSLDLKEPIEIYWIKYTKYGKTEPLTKIQQHFAYGLKFFEVTPERAEFQFVSYSKRTLKLRKTFDGSYGVFTETDGKEVKLERVFIQIDGGTFWFPKITWVEIHAKIPEVNQLVVEVIKP